MEAGAERGPERRKGQLGSGNAELQAQDRTMEAGHNKGSTCKEPDAAFIGRGSPAEMLSTTGSRDERGTVRGHEGPHHLEGRREIPPSTKAARAAAAQ